MNYYSSDESSTNISCKKRRASSPDGVGAKKCQRLDESMIGMNLPTAAELTAEAYSSSSSSEVDGPALNTSCGEAAAESHEEAAAAAAESSSLSIVDSIFPSSHIQSSDNDAAAQPHETISTTITPSSPTAAAAASAAALRCNKKSMVLSPNDFFTAELRSRGYPATTFCSLKGGYHSTPTVSVFVVPPYSTRLRCPSSNM
jgi:hypothetical protein